MVESLISVLFILAPVILSITLMNIYYQFSFTKLKKKKKKDSSRFSKES